MNLKEALQLFNYENLNMFVSLEQLKRDRNKLLLMYHPDKNTSDNATTYTQFIMSAYEIIKNNVNQTKEERSNQTKEKEERREELKRRMQQERIREKEKNIKIEQDNRNIQKEQLNNLADTLANKTGRYLISIISNANEIPFMAIPISHIIDKNTLFNICCKIERAAIKKPRHGFIIYYGKTEKNEMVDILYYPLVPIPNHISLCKCDNVFHTNILYDI